MALNIVYEEGHQLDMKLDSPATGGKSGDVGRVGDRIVILLVDQDADGYATVKFNGAASVPVKGINAGGNVAVAVNDVIYFTDGDTPHLSKKATGTRAGLAMGPVGSGATATITVRLG